MLLIPDCTYLQYAADSAARIDRAIGSSISIHDDAAQLLRLQAKCGFSEQFARAVETVVITQQTACARAVRERKHIVIEDVVAPPVYEPYLFAQLGPFRSVRALPLFDTQNRVVGVLTTQFSAVHSAGSEHVTALEAWARIAARIIEAVRVRDAICESDIRSGILKRNWTSIAMQTADASRMLLSTINSEHSLGVVEATERVLLSLITELREQLRATSMARSPTS